MECRVADTITHFFFSGAQLAFSLLLREDLSLHVQAKKKILGLLLCFFKRIIGSLVEKSQLSESMYNVAICMAVVYIPVLFLTALLKENDKASISFMSTD